MLERLEGIDVKLAEAERARERNFQMLALAKASLKRGTLSRKRAKAISTDLARQLLITRDAYLALRKSTDKGLADDRCDNVLQEMILLKEELDKRFASFTSPSERSE
jgi:hypothetical protein